MGRWTYYSPLLIGVILVLLVNDTIRAGLGTMEPVQQWLRVAVLAVVVAVQCQVLMIGAQGAFAQVLPVPGGRSIRGTGATAGGWLLIVWVVLSVVAAVLYSESVTLAAYICGGSAIAALFGFGIVYFWNVPTAVADFGTERYRLD